MNPKSLETLAAQRHFNFSRRSFLRGLGACVALPAFESLGSLNLLAAPVAKGLATTASGAPLRAAFLCFPNGAIPSAWWPTEAGKDYAASETLKPLDPVREHLQLLGGLDQKSAYGGADGGGDHARGNGVFLTGVRLKKSATDIRAGPRDRASDAVPFAGTQLGRGSYVGRVRLRLCLCLPV
jgi:hypothetical protein